MKRRMITFLTVLCMMVSMLPVAALAAEEFSIGITCTEGGSAAAGSETAGAGELVRVTVTAEEGYTLSAISATRADNEVAMIPLGSVYFFVMPEGDVQVSVTFKAQETWETGETEQTTHRHTLELVNMKEATETEAGYTGDLVCPGCGETLIEGTEIPAAGEEKPEEESGHTHVIERQNAVEPTYLFPGYTGDLVCTECGEVVEKGSVIPAAGSSGTNRENPFTDVGRLAYYYDSVLWAYYGGVTTGKTAATFDPDDYCTRAQVVTFLWRALGQPEPGVAECPFEDVAEDAYYYKAVLWAVEKGITTGTTAARFAPDQRCTRGQVVTFLWRSQSEPKPQASTNPFPDVQAGAYYHDAVLWAVEEGITTGMTDGTFHPDTNCSRAQVVTFLYRLLAE